MHDACREIFKRFVLRHMDKEKECKILEVGSRNINGTMRKQADSKKWEYTGIDIIDGDCVDIIVKEHDWDNIENNYYDYVISSQAFEHIRYPWVVAKLVYDKCKDGGKICIIAPNRHHYHPHPVDCYRYMKDGFEALFSEWAGFKTILCAHGGDDTYYWGQK